MMLSHRHRMLGVTAALLAVVGCAESEVAQRQPSSAVDGIQLTGVVAGHRLAVSDGSPSVQLGDCDPADPGGIRLCVLARTIDGTALAIVVKNPDALMAGEVLPVRRDACQGEACGAIGDVAVVAVRLDDRQLRAEAGRLRVTSAGPRYTGTFTFMLGGGDRLDGSFDVLPAS